MFGLPVGRGPNSLTQADARYQEPPHPQGGLFNDSVDARSPAGQHNSGSHFAAAEADHLSEGDRHHSPSPGQLQSFPSRGDVSHGGQYTAVAEHKQAQEHAAGATGAAALSAGREAVSAPTLLPPPAFQILRPPAAPDSELCSVHITAPGQLEAGHGRLEGQQAQQQQQQPEPRPMAYDDAHGPDSSQAPHVPAATPQAAPAADRLTEITALLQQLPPEQVLECLRSMKANAEAPHHTPPVSPPQQQEEQEQGPAPEPPLPRQQQQPQPAWEQLQAPLPQKPPVQKQQMSSVMRSFQQSSLQQQQQQQQGLAGSSSAPVEAPRPAPALPGTASAPVGAGRAADWQLAAATAAPAPWQRQQTLQPPRFLSEAGEYKEEIPLSVTLQRLLQQQHHHQQQRQQQTQEQAPLDQAVALPALPGVTSAPQPQPQQQQQPGGMRAAKSLQGHLQPLRPLPPPEAGPSSTAADFLQVMQCLTGAGASSMAAQQPAATTAAAAAPQLRQAGVQQRQADSNLLQAAVQGMATAMMQSNTTLAAAAAAGPPPPPSSAVGRLGDAGVANIGSNSHPVPAAAAAGPIPAAPAPAAGMPAGGFFALLQQLSAVQQQQQQQPGLTPAAPAAATTPWATQQQQLQVQAPPAVQQLLLQQQQQQQQQPEFDKLLGIVASVVSSITGSSSGSSSNPRSPGNRRLFKAAQELLDALKGTDPTGNNTAAAAAAAAAGAAALKEEPYDPVAAAAAPRDVPLPASYRQRGSSGQLADMQQAWGGVGGSGTGGGDSEAAGEWQGGGAAGSRGWGPRSSHQRYWGEGGGGYGLEDDRPAVRRGRGRPPKGKGPAGKTPAGPQEPKNNLFALLAALEQQEQLEGDAGESSGDMMDEDGASVDAAADAAAAAAAPWDGRISQQAPSDAEPMEQRDVDGGEEGAAVHGRQRQQRPHHHQHSPELLLKPRQKRVREAPHPAAAAVVSEALTEQRWLLKRRAGNKRPVKPNEAFASYAAPNLLDPRTGQRLPSHLNAANQRPAPKHRRNMHYDPSDPAAAAALPVDFIDGPHLPRRKITRPRTSWGWYLVGKGHLQQQQQEEEGDAQEVLAVGGAGAVGSEQLVHPAEPAVQCSVSSGITPGAVEAAGGSGGDTAAATSAGDAVGGSSGMVAAAAAGPTGAAALSAPPSTASDGAAAAAAAASDAVTGKVSFSTAAAAAGQAAEAAAASPDGGKRHRWVAGSHQWETDDGVTVWPKDTLVTPDQRVFYVAFKWVQQHWLHRVYIDNHIASLPVEFWLDGEHTDLELTANIRLYDKAAHMVVTPYSGLSKRFVGTWLAGYGFDANRGVIRLYLATQQPQLPKSGGKKAKASRGGATGANKPALVAAAATAVTGPQPFIPAAAAGGSADGAGQQQQQQLQQPVNTGAASLAAQGPAAAAADVGAAGALGAAAGVDSGQSGQQRHGKAGRQQLQLVGRKRRKGVVLGGGAVGVPDSVWLETVHAPTAAVLAADAAGAAMAPSQQQQQQQQQEDEAAVKRQRPSRSAAAGVVAATLAAGGGSGSGLATGAHQAAAADEDDVKKMLRSALNRAAVERRWAKFRQDKAQDAPRKAAADGAVLSGVASGTAATNTQEESPVVLQLPVLEGRQFAADVGVINRAVLCVSDALQLPEELLVGLSMQLVRVLEVSQTAGPTGATGAAAGEGKTGEAAKSEAAAAAGGSEGSCAVAVLHAAMTGWYQQLCGAVLEHDGSRVAQLFEDLGSKVLQAAQ